MSTATAHRRIDLAELVRAHQAALWRYLRFLGCDEPEADDLAQETFLAVWRKPFEERSTAATNAYLRSVARNLFLGLRRKQRRQVSAGGLDAADAVWQRFVSDERPDAFLEALTECLDTLDGRARQAIDLRYRDGAGRDDIAQSLDLSAEGAKTLLRRTRELLRRCVQHRTRK
jgi:RNA polymerase sigma-70 factor (ECF subfamily)